MVLFVSVPKRSATWVSALTEMTAIQNNGDDTWKLFAQMRQGVFPVSSWFYLLFPWGFLFRILPISFIQQLAQLKIINLFNFIDQLWVFFGPQRLNILFFVLFEKTFTLQSRRTNSGWHLNRWEINTSHIPLKYPKSNSLLQNYFAKNLSLTLPQCSDF